MSEINVYNDGSEYNGEYGIVKGPDSDGDFEITGGDGGWVFVDDKMLDFMIEHRQVKGKSDG